MMMKEGAMAESRIIDIAWKVQDGAPGSIMAVLGDDCIAILGLDFVMGVARDAARTTRLVPHMNSRGGRPEIAFDGEVHDEAITLILDRIMEMGCSVRFDDSALPGHFRR